MAYVDRAVQQGRGRSRADLLARLIARDARRERAEQDLARPVESGALHDPEMLAIAVATSATSLPFD